jgi:hypothetical protein
VIKISTFTSTKTSVDQTREIIANLRRPDRTSVCDVALPQISSFAEQFSNDEVSVNITLLYNRASMSTPHSVIHARSYVEEVEKKPDDAKDAKKKGVVSD